MEQLVVELFDRRRRETGIPVEREKRIDFRITAWNDGTNTILNSQA
jgi:hypothetical protein